MRRNRGFTLIELLIVIAIIGVLLGLLMPVVTNAKISAKKTQCASNLRTLGQAMIAYGSDNDRKVPVFGADGDFLWDIPKRTRDAIVKYGAARKNFYCPSVERETDDTFWNYSNGSPNLDTGWTAAGYWFLTKRLPKPPAAGGTPVNPATLPADKLHSSKFVFQERDPSKAFKKKLRESFDAERAAELELVTDATMSTGSAGARKFTGLSGTLYQQASHLTSDKKKAEGGNILFMDGRVEWRRWAEPPSDTKKLVPDDQMQIRYRPPGRNIDQWF